MKPQTHIFYDLYDVYMRKYSLTIIALCLDALRLFQGVVMLLHHVVSNYCHTGTAPVKVALQPLVATKDVLAH